MNYDFERELQRSFRRAELPLAPDSLRQALIGLPRSIDLPGRSSRRASSALQPWMRVAAVVALFAVFGGAVLYGITRWLPGTGPSPSPTPTVSPTAQETSRPTASALASATQPSPFVPLPEPQQLLAEYPDAQIAYARGAGPADRPVSESLAVDEFELGPLEFPHDVVLAGTCLGPGDLTIEARWLNVPGATDPFAAFSSSCDGAPRVFVYTPDLQGGSLEVTRMVVASGASWRVAIGALPEASSAPASHAPISGTAGWWRLWDVELESVDPSTGMGAGVRVADDVRHLGIWVECSGIDEVTLDVIHDSPSPTSDLSVPVVCGGDASRVEVSVAAGEDVSIKATPASAVPIHIYIEADAMPVSVWGEPPALPIELADSPFIASSGNLVALGTLGGARQSLVAVPGVGSSNRPDGDNAAIPIHTAAEATLRLFSISTGEELRTLAEHGPGSFIRTTWVDALHEQVFYTVLSSSAGRLEAYRVALDGTGQALLASVPTAGGLPFANLSLDGETFLIDSCRERTCERTIIETGTLESRTIEITLDAEVCDGAGVTDAIVVLRVAQSCATSAPEELLVVDIDGAEVLRMPDPGSVTLVRTTEGPMLLTRSLTDGGTQLVDMADGSTRPLTVGDSTLSPAPGMNLPPNWVLLAPFSGIGDFPIHPMLLLGNPPTLVNVLTGEAIDMSNLPH